MELFVLASSRQPERYYFMSLTCSKVGSILLPSGTTTGCQKNSEYFKGEHFDVLTPLGEATNADNVQLTYLDKFQQPPTTSEPMDCEQNLSCIVSQLTDLLILEESASPPLVTKPVKGGGGRKRFTGAIRKNR